jgi:hypothetical protein
MVSKISCMPCRIERNCQEKFSANHGASPARMPKKTAYPDKTGKKGNILISAKH